RFAPFRCVQRLYRIAVHDSFAFRQRENGSKPETQMVQSTLRQMLRLPIQEGLQLVPCDLIHKPRIERRHEMSLDSVFLGHTSAGLPLSTPDGKIDSLNEMSERIGFGHFIEAVYLPIWRGKWKASTRMTEENRIQARWEDR